jgi:hypothetical protein
MSKTAPAKTSKWLEPINPNFIEALRRDAQSIGLNADQMAQETFNRPLDALTVAEGFKLNCQVYAAINERRNGPKADCPHTVECISCHRAFTCHCERQHDQGECHYCHNNTDAYTERRIRFHFGD